MASTLEVDQVKHSSGVAFTLPQADGSAGHLLKTNGSRVLSFVADTDTGIVNVDEDKSPQLGDLDCNGAQIQWSKGADVASATALVLLTDGNFFDVTGTVTITSFNTTGGPGTQIKLQFDAACLLTHHATDLKLPGGANITTAAGDVAEFIEYAAGDYICTSYTKADGKAVVASNSATIGLATIWVPAVAMYGVTTNPPDSASVETTATRPELKVLDFDAGTNQYAQFVIAMPNSWNRSTITFTPYWVPASTNTGNCIWGLQAVSFGDSDPADVAFGTVQTSTDAGIGTLEDVQVGPESSAITVGGTPLDEDITFFQIYRDAAAGGDTFSADARLLGVKILFTTDQENDA